MPDKFLWNDKALRQQRYLNDNTRSFIAEGKSDTPVALNRPVLVRASETVNPGAAGQFQLVQQTVTGQFFPGPEKLVGWNLIMEDAIGFGQWCLAWHTLAPGSDKLLWVVFRVPPRSRGQGTNCDNCAAGSPLYEFTTLKIEGVQPGGRNIVVAQRMNGLHELSYRSVAYQNVTNFPPSVCFRVATYWMQPFLSDLFVGTREWWNINFELSVLTDNAPTPEYWFSLSVELNDWPNQRIFESTRSTSKVACSAETELTLVGGPSQGPELDFSQATITVNPPLEADNA